MERVNLEDKHAPEEELGNDREVAEFLPSFDEHGAGGNQSVQGVINPDHIRDCTDLEQVLVDPLLHDREAIGSIQKVILREVHDDALPQSVAIDDETRDLGDHVFVGFRSGNGDVRLRKAFHGNLQEILLVGVIERFRGTRW